MRIRLDDGTRLYFDTHGEKRAIHEAYEIIKPTIIFLHGGPGLADHTLYVPFWSKFKDCAQVVFLDLRGHGRSDGHDDEINFNLKSWARDVKEFADKLDIEKPVVMGFSFGGWVALQYAIDFPDHHGGLILCNSEHTNDYQLRAEKYHQKALRLQKTEAEATEIKQGVLSLGDGSTPSTESAEKYLQVCGPLFSEMPTDPVMEQIWALCKQNPKAWEVFDLNEQYKFNHLESLPLIRGHILSVSGSLDPEHPAELAAVMCKSMTNAQSVTHEIIEGAGDPVDNDKPKETTAIIVKFLLTHYPQIEPLVACSKALSSGREVVKSPGLFNS